MLKLLLNHWQAHREPLPFVLTEDPLYCSHLTKSPFPEVYSVNRINPIYEEDESSAPNNLLKRSLSEERRENETRNSDDTGYSSTRRRSASLNDDANSLETRRMSSDSDESSHPEEVVVSVDVHRVPTSTEYYTQEAFPSESAPHSHTSAIAYEGSHSSSSELAEEPYDSLTMSEETPKKTVSTDAKNARTTSVVRERLQRLLEKGNDNASETFPDSPLDAKPDLEKTRQDLMKSLTRALNNKAPNRENFSQQETVTRSDSTLVNVHQTHPKSLDRKSNTSSTSPKSLYFSNQAEGGVTRQDESSPSSSISFVKPKKHRSKNHPTEKDSKRNSSSSNQEPPDAKGSYEPHTCKFCKHAQRPMAFHQLLPGHWSYDNVYLPQIPGVCYSCMYRHNPVNPYQQSSEDDVFFPRYYHPSDVPRSRHSWAPFTNSRLEVPSKKRDRVSSQKDSSRETSTSRYSPDGSSRETDSSQTDSGPMSKSRSERRSLREPKKCKCEHCLGSVLDGDPLHPPFLGSHTCPCHFPLSANRRVKFASDTDVSQHRHMHAVPLRTGKSVEKQLVNGEPINAAFVMSLPHLNGHALNGGQKVKENGLNAKSPKLIPRGLKEPIKVDELYRSYPINFREWEAHYRRNFLQKRRKRALNMVGMAIGIILVVGIAVALTFVFLRIRRTP